MFSRADPREGGPALDIERGTPVLTLQSDEMLTTIYHIHSHEQARESGTSVHLEDGAPDRSRVQQYVLSPFSPLNIAMAKRFLCGRRLAFAAK